jgi:tetratricopeptide (TPR) repeat protein
LPFWYPLGYFSEGREHLLALLELAATQADQAVRDNEAADPVPQTSLLEYRAKALNAVGILTTAQGDYSAARAHAEQALILWRELGDKSGIAISLNSLGNLAHEQGDYPTARLMFGESLILRRQLGDKLPIGSTLVNLATVLRDQREYGQARSLFVEGLALFRKTGYKFGIAFSLQSLGQSLYLQGDYAEARPLIEEALVIFRQIRDKRGIGFTLNDLGALALEENDCYLARSLCAESLTIQQETGDKLGMIASLIGLASVSVGCATSSASGSWRAGRGRQSEVERGVRLLGAVEALFESMGVVALLSQFRTPYARSIAASQAQLDEELYKRVWEEGRAMSMQQAIAYAREGWEE